MDIITYGALLGKVKDNKPTDAQVAQAVDDYLDDHPEATTTVQDGAITYAKLDSNLKGSVDDVADLKSQIEAILVEDAGENATLTNAKNTYDFYSNVSHSKGNHYYSDGVFTYVPASNATAVSPYVLNYPMSLGSSKWLVGFKYKVNKLNQSFGNYEKFQIILGSGSANTYTEPASYDEWVYFSTIVNIDLVRIYLTAYGFATAPINTDISIQIKDMYVYDVSTVSSDLCDVISAAQNTTYADGTVTYAIPTTYAPDTTLEISGKAADSKAVGDAISDVVGDVSDIDTVVSLYKDEHYLPDVFYEERESVYAAAQTNDADLRLLVFSDPHNDEADRYKKYAMMMEQGCIDALVGLGDNTPYTKVLSKAQSLQQLRTMLSFAGRNRNCYYLVGNHDVAFQKTNSGELSFDYTMTKQQCYDLMCRQLDNTVIVDEDNPYGGYYYVDYAAQKIRLIVLNTSDIWESDGTLLYKYSHSVMFHQRQITWFSEIALNFTNKDTPSDWSVLVLTHAHIADTDGQIIVNKILENVKNGSAYSKTFTVKRRLTYDASTQTYSAVIDESQSDTLVVNADYSVQGPINVIAMFNGHDHAYVNRVLNGINLIGFCADSALISQFYVADINGISAGNYYIVDKNGNKYGFTVTSDIPWAQKVIVDNYLSVNSQTTYIRMYKDNGDIAKVFNATRESYQDGYTLLPTVNGCADLIHQQFCTVVSIDKSTRKITGTPFGFDFSFEMSY